MIIMFVSGSIKYAERTLCLYSASLEIQRSDALNDLSDDLSKLQTPDFQPSSMTSYVFDCILEGRYPGNESGRRETYFFSVDAPQNMLQSIICANDVPGILEKKFVSNPSRYKAYDYVGEFLEYFYQQRYTKYPLRQFFYYELWCSCCEYETNYIVPARARKLWSEELAQYSLIKSQYAAVQADTMAASSIRRWISKYFGSPITVSIIGHTPIKKLILDNLLHFGTRAEWNCSSSRGQLALR
uniref:DUF4220 domain-containing protein n=1 Tax=Oryza glumipatula TaxID=40148 RepID=A0A0E0BUN2_9ORYZ